MKKIIAIAAAFALCLTLGACSSAPAEDQSDSAEQEQATNGTTLDYKVADEKIEFARGEKTGQAYRVAINPEATEAELKTVFEVITADDGFELHEVWFYSDERLTDGSAAYDVALVTRDSAEGEAIVTLATDEAKAAAQELLAQADTASQSGEDDGSGAENEAEEGDSSADSDESQAAAA